ncbi:metallophosphoesterase [Bacteroidota bacterium]
MLRTALFSALLLIASGTLAQSERDPAVIDTDTSGNVHPWNHLKLNNSPENFQFAIVTDRTGGHRPGVFEDAVRKLNLMQPEFVVSVGDLIEGYTSDRDRINEEWDEFTGFIEKLQMPFFYLPGNHDYTNEVMAGIWEERFGPSYYHFVYQDVLFLCLNSEEAIKGSNLGGIEKPQYEYIKKTLEQHPEVKWTLVFMHQPLWLFDNTRHWNDVEMLLKERKHTVFVGHHHHYVKYERNNSNYIMLATTGGTSKLRGPNFGEFDHMVWVTMTDSGPVIANLLLQGIWDENVVTEELTEMIQAERMQIEPIFVENGFTEGEFKLKITNDANYPMWTILRFGDSKYLRPEILEFQKSVPPNSVELLDIPVISLHGSKLKVIKPIPLLAWYVYKYEDGRNIQLDQQFSLAPVKKNFIKKSEEKIRVDGYLEDWTGLPYRGGIQSIVTAGQKEYMGDYDAHFDFNITYDNDNLYLCMAVWDDKIELNRSNSLWAQDAVLINLDPRDVLTSSNDRTDNNYFNEYFHLYFTPSLSKLMELRIDQEERLPEGTELVTRKSLEGFNVELSIPLDYIRSLGGDNWETIRLNIAYFDRDSKALRSAIWWKPNWSSAENYIGSGMFFKTPAK